MRPSLEPYGTDGIRPSRSRSDAICLRIALENDGQALFILRHHGGLPTAPHTLVEEIGERVLVLTSVPGQAMNHRLVFFHGRENSSLAAMTTTPAFANLTLVRHPL